MRPVPRPDGGDLIGKAPRGWLDRAIAAAGTLTGKRFGLLVASSVVATSAIVAAAMSNPTTDLGPLAGLLGRSLASDSTPVEASPTPGSEPDPGPSSPSGGGSSASPAPAPPPAAAPSAAPAPVPEEPEKAPEEPAPAPLPEPGPVKHVFVVSLISPGYEAAFGAGSQMPYLSATLRPQGELLSGYSLLDGDDTLPNSLAAVSGQRPSADSKLDCPSFDDCVFPVETTTIADQLTIGRLTWHAYAEGMTDPATGEPGNCAYPGAGEPYPPAEGGYTATRNPFVYFHSLLDLGDCATDDMPLTELDADLRKADSTPNLSYVSPTLCNAGSTEECPEGKVGGPAAADAFLAEWAPKILASPAYKADGLLIVLFDRIDPAGAGEAVPAAAPESPSKKVGALLVSRFLAPGSTDPKPYDPYSVLRSTEDAFGLAHLGAAGGAKVGSFTAALGEGTGD